MGPTGEAGKQQPWTALSLRQHMLPVSEQDSWKPMLSFDQTLRQCVVLVTFCAGCALGAGFVGSSAAALDFPSPDLPAACFTYNMHHVHKLSKCMEEILKHTAERNLQYSSKSRQHGHVTMRSCHAAAANAWGQALSKQLTLGAVGLPLKEPTLIPSDSMLPPSSCSGVAFFIVMLTYLQGGLHRCSAESPAAAQRVEKCF